MSHVCRSPAVLHHHVVALPLADQAISCMHRIQSSAAASASHPTLPAEGRTSKEDKSSIYVMKVDADDPVPACEQAFRQQIREKLSSVFAKHGVDGHVSVRPLDVEVHLWPFALLAHLERS